MIWSLTILSCNICDLTYAKCVVTYVQCLVTYAQSVVIYAQCTMLLSQSNQVFFLFPSDHRCFGDELNRSSKMALQIFELMKIESKYLDISNCVFTMNCSTDKKIVFWSFLGRDFIYMWEKFQHCQSSNSSYLQKYPIFSTTNVPLLFFCLDICIFTSVQTKKIAFGRKMSKI